MNLQENPFPAAERILADIEAVFKKDPKLAEFDIVPVSEHQNKSPVLHASHSLGLESWCVRHVFCYIYQRLMDLRKKRRREDSAAIMRLLRGALLLNPDIASFWHMRKDLTLSSHLDPLVDLHFSAIVLSYKPKCSEAFSHRRWLTSQLLGMQTYSTSGEVITSPLCTARYSSSEALENELEVAGSAANRYANNYHAWNHRIWAIQHICAPSSLWSVLLKEWDYTSDWVASHVSDHSGMQYRQFLLERIMSLSSTNGEDVDGIYKGEDCALVCNGKHVTLTSMMDVLKRFRERRGDDLVLMKEISTNKHLFEKLFSFVSQELLYNTDLICRFVGHEALWCHRRFVITTFVKVAKNCALGDLRDQLLVAMQTQEQLLVSHCIFSTPIDVHQMRFAKRHALWLGQMLNMSVTCELN